MDSKVTSGITQGGDYSNLNNQQTQVNHNWSQSNSNFNGGMSSYYMNGGFQHDALQQDNFGVGSGNFGEGQDMSLQKNLSYVQEFYPQLINLNATNFRFVERVKQQKDPKFFVIKSFTEEDFHKSIKYSCWSSTKEGNKKLHNVYQYAQQSESDVFLFFSMNGSGRFIGVCQMKSPVDYSIKFDYWAMDEVWKGLFQVEWIFIKDVPNKILHNIKLANNYYKSVTNSRDTQEIPRTEGEYMLYLFDEFKYQTSILQHFQYYDERQELFDKAKISQMIIK